MSEKRSEFELDERAAEARFILNNPIFVEAVDRLRDRYTKNLMSSGIGTEQAVMSHARMVVLEELLAQIGSAITDQRMAKQRKPNYGN
jgi:hypothetical protein